MTLKSYVVGRQTQAMLTQGTDWGTVASGGDGLLFEDASFNWDQTRSELTLSNSYWKERLEAGQITCSLDITQPFMFNDLRCLAFALGMGGYADPVEQTAGMGDYLHQIVPDSSVSGLYASLACRRATALYTVFPSCAFSGFELSGSTDPNRLMIKHSAVADTALNTSAGITDAEFDGLSYAYDQRAYFRNCKVYLGDSSGAALTTDEEITGLISSFSFSFQRSLSSDYTNSSGNSIEAPVEEGPPQISCKLGLVHKDATAAGLFDDRLNATEKQLLLEVQAGPANPAAGGAHENSRLTIEIPAAVITSDSYLSFDGMNRQTAEVNFDIVAPASQAAGMPFDQPFRLTVINNQSAKAITAI